MLTNTCSSWVSIRRPKKKIQRLKKENLVLYITDSLHLALTELAVIVTTTIIMGNIITRIMNMKDRSRKWPPKYTNKKHWCFESGTTGEYTQHYCDEPSAGGSKYDTNFDYSVFSCRKAKCQTCVDLDPELYPDRAMWHETLYWKEFDPEAREIHVTWKSLLESAIGGCEICSILKEGISRVGGSKAKVPENIFCIELLNGFTVRLTHETPDDPVEEVERLVVEFHRGLGRYFLRSRMHFLTNCFRRNDTVKMESFWGCRNTDERHWSCGVCQIYPKFHWKLRGTP